MFFEFRDSYVLSLWTFNVRFTHSHIMAIVHTDRSPNLGQKTRPNNNQQQKKRICKIVDFVVPANHRIKLKECEKKDKYLDLARELKKYGT